MATKNLAIMFTDIKGFTARTSASTRDDVQNLIDEHDRLLRPVFRHFQGTIVKTIGDAFLVYFHSPTDAVICGLTVQSVLKKFNSTVSEDQKIAVRVAINVGDVQMMDGDILGEPVNIAARLEAITEPGEVWFTEAVYLTMNRKEAPTTEIGEHTFKGIPLPVRVYKVILDPPGPQIQHIDHSVHLEGGVPRIAGLGPTIKPRARWQPWALGAILALLIGPFMGFWAYDAHLTRRMDSQVEKLISIGDPDKAFNLIRELMTKKPDDPALRAKAVAAVEMSLENRLSREKDLQVVFDWLNGLLREKRYLQPLEPHLVSLEARISLSEAIASPGRDSSFWQEFRSLNKRYPNSPDIPLIAVEILRTNNRHPFTFLWPYELLIERIGEPKDPELRDSIFNAAVRSFESSAPGSSYAVRAHAITGAHFRKEREDWAREPLVEGGGAAVLNALEILHDADDRAIMDNPFYNALRAIHAADADCASLAYLDRLEDSRDGKLAFDVITQSKPYSRSGVSVESRALFREMAKNLRDRFGG